MATWKHHNIAQIVQQPYHSQETEILGVCKVFHKGNQGLYFEAFQTFLKPIILNEVQNTCPFYSLLYIYSMLYKYNVLYRNCDVKYLLKQLIGRVF